MNSCNILENIEKSLPPDCELLIRTNHNPDGLSGIPKEEGKWFVHIISSSGHKEIGNVKHKSVYKKCGDDLFNMIIEAFKYTEDWSKHK